MHYAILIPGLGDDRKKLALVTAHWKKHGLVPLVHSVGWRDEEPDFDTKLNKLLDVVDALFSQGNTVSLVGTSAGGSAVLNAFYKRRDKIHKVINVCGRLREGSVNGFRSFKSRTATSPAFAASVKLCESHESLWTAQDKSKIMTLRPFFGDELVPSTTATLDGAINKVIPTGEHAFSIAMALTLLSRPLIDFIKTK